MLEMLGVGLWVDYIVECFENKTVFKQMHSSVIHNKMKRKNLKKRMDR